MPSDITHGLEKFDNGAFDAAQLLYLDLSKVVDAEVIHDPPNKAIEPGDQSIEFFSDRPTLRDQDNQILRFLPGKADSNNHEFNMGRLAVTNPTVLSAATATPEERLNHGSKRTSWHMQETFQNLDGFLDSIEEKVNHNPQHKVAVFIPGFHTTFDHGAASAAALQRDLGIPVVLDSWPSNERVTLAGYLADEDADVASLRNVGSHIIDAIARRVGPQNMVLVGFSQGSKVAIQYAINRQAVYFGFARPFYAQIFARADEQEQEFKGQFNSIVRNARHTALFNSPDDRGLATSGLLHIDRRTGNALASEFSIPQSLVDRFAVVDNSYANNGIINHEFDTRGIGRWFAGIQSR